MRLVLPIGALALLAALSPLTVRGQQPGSVTPQRDARSAETTGSGAIRGRVTASDTSEPLRRAQIRLLPITAEMTEPRTATTGDDGRFEFAQLPPGRYGLSASKGGFVQIEYGQRRPFEKGRPLDLADAQVLERVDLSLPRGAVVSGRVTDEAGEPVTSAWVSLGRYRYFNGRRQLTSAFGDSTDDRGEFRIFGIAPADYVLSASLGDVGRSSDRVRYVRTFLPGTPSIADAQRVRVNLGEEIAGITIALLRQRAVSISGVVRSTTSSPSLFMMVDAQSTDGDRSDSQFALVGRDGSFSMTGLLPGTYRLEVRPAHAGDGYASAEVKVGDTDVSGVVLTLAAGGTARGQVRFEGGTPPRDVRPAEVILVAVANPEVGTNGELPRPPVRSDWTFELTNLHGRRVLQGGTIGGWRVKAVSLAGRDITDEPIDFSNGDVDGIEVLLSNRSSEVTGRVTDGRGVVAGDATVVIFGADAEKWTTRTRYISVARPDQQGRFRIEGLPAARYLAIAVDYLEEGQERDPELLKEWARIATSFTLGDGERRALDLRIVSSN